MRLSVIFALLGLGSHVSSQKIDLDFIKAARPDRSIIDVVDAKSGELAEFDKAKAIENVIASIRKSPLEDFKQGSVQAPDAFQKRDDNDAFITIELVDLEEACTILNGTLNGDDPNDSEEVRVQKFLNNVTLHEEALDAVTPQNYTLVFQNLTNSTIQANGYLGYYVLSSYNVSECAQRCSDTTGCQAFNIFFERAPSLVPGPDCQNPPALVNSKCALWGGPISAGNALNAGQYRQLFHVVVSASNGYVLSSTIGPLSTLAIDAPLDCNTADTYMGFRLFNTSLPFSEDLCAAACEETSRYAIAHPPSDPRRPPQLCTFYNTYILSKNSISQGQMCAMYSQYWNPRVYAKNAGQYDGEGNNFTIASSVFSGNISLPICPTDIPDLRLDTEVSEFCTSYISYPGPPTVSTTIVSASATFGVCSTPTANGTASIVSAPTPRFARRDHPGPEIIDAFINVYPSKVEDPTVTGSVPAQVQVSGSKVLEPGVISSAISEAVAVLGGDQNITGTPTAQSLAQITIKPTIYKRQGQVASITPGIFEGRDYRVVSSACSQIVDTTTRTQTETSTPEATLAPQFDCSNFPVCNNGSSITRLTSDSIDDAVYNVGLPFQICVYDACSAQVGISTNGFLTIGSSTSAYYNNADIPASDFGTQGVLFGFWDDLYFSPSLGDYLQFSICGEEGSQSVTISWNARSYGNRSQTIDFSATFYQNQNGTLLQYNQITDGGRSATVGAQGLRNESIKDQKFAYNQPFAVAPFSTLFRYDDAET